MQLSLNWLKDFVDIPKSITPEKLGLKLTMHTVEVDGIKKQAEKLDNVVIGEILEIKKHPNADKLNIAQVDVGEEKSRQIVFGQILKVKVGQKIPVALAPTILPDNKKIEKTKLRGEISEGMFCLDQELGLSKDGISAHFFDKKVKNGTSIIETLELDDIIFEVDNKSITNRSDLWGHYGMAREIATFLNVKFKKYKKNFQFSSPAELIEDNFQTNSKFKTREGLAKSIQNSKFKTNNIEVRVEDFNLCSRYMAIALDGIEIKNSPEWMQKRLINVGMRPINNIVDITNYVMLELGQPTHIFDLRKIFKFQFSNSNFQTNSKFKNNIIIRKAGDNEIIETLDGGKRKLDDGMLVIANNEKPIAIAGIMGGKNSEVDNNTTSILIESANFNSVLIRKTAQKLDLRTEASIRFEKSLDPNLCEIALARIIELIKESCQQAKIISKLKDEKKYFLNQGPIELDLEWVNKRIGKKIEKKKIIEILENLGFEIKKNSNILTITIPTWRATKDILIPEDLIEEIARIYGYDNLDSQMPKITMQAPEINNEHLLERKIKNILSEGAKLTEVYNYSFISEDQLVKLKIKPSLTIKLANPLSEDLVILRPSLVPGLLKNIKINQAKEEALAFYEIGNIFLNKPGKINKNNKGKETLFFQEQNLAIILANKQNVDNEVNDLFARLKSIITYLLISLGMEVVFKKAQIVLDWTQDSVTAAICVNDKEIGRATVLGKDILRAFGVKKQAIVAEINFIELNNLAQKQKVKQFKEPLKYPQVARDLAFVISEEILYNDIKQEIKNFNPLISRIELFDVYQGDKIGQGKKNLAWHLTYQADRTLTSSEVDKVQLDLIKQLEKKFFVKIRDF
ncbi:MAG: phenylalanine--tRNA ligase subunit beta [Patescibacteria group bacterium]